MMKSRGTRLSTANFFKRPLGTAGGECVRPLAWSGGLRSMEFLKWSLAASAPRSFSWPPPGALGAPWPFCTAMLFRALALPIIVFRLPRSAPATVARLALRSANLDFCVPSLPPPPPTATAAAPAATTAAAAAASVREAALPGLSCAEAPEASAGPAAAALGPPTSICGGPAVVRSGKPGEFVEGDDDDSDEGTTSDRAAGSAAVAAANLSRSVFKLPGICEGSLVFG
mmetsp:Transcript_56280/g.182748  ORF Transcript_56280/g.182748 Transcript_56280/m.182748 type:complete len:228 (-) Transcript_56280:398-1081(-)